MRFSGFVKTSRQGAVGVLCLNRAARAHAYNDSMLDDLRTNFERFVADEAVRAIIITAEGTRHFCAGADLDEMRDRDPLATLSLKSQLLFTLFARSSKPTVAAVNGAAMGGGVELALACDLRLASEHARFGFPETSLGLIPAAGATQRLPQVVGQARAREMILMGLEVDAPRAFEIGLVGAVVPGDRLRDTALEWGEQLARRDPLALALAKQAIDLPVEQDAGLRLERVSQALLQFRKRAGGMP